MVSVAFINDIFAFLYSFWVLSTAALWRNDTEETSDEEQDRDGNSSSWWTAVALFTLRGTLLQMFQSKGRDGKG